MKKTLFVLAVLLLGLAGSVSAIDVQNFQPAVGTQNLLTLYSSTTYAQGQFGFGLLANYTGNPLTLSYADDRELRVVERMLTGDLQFAVGAADIFELGVAGSYSYTSGKDMDDRALTDVFFRTDQTAISGFGDVRVMAKIRALENKRRLLGIAIVLLGQLPVGDPHSYHASEGFNGGGRLVLDKRFDRVNIALNGGYRYVPDTSGQAEFGVGVTVLAHPVVELTGEFFGRTVDYGIDDINLEVPLEAVAAIKLFAGPVHFTLGGGAGVNAGLGNPAYRVFGGVATTIPKQKRELPAPAVKLVQAPPPDPRTTDTDRDGLTDYVETNQHKTDPQNADTDGDGLADGLELSQSQTDPTKTDTDGDELTDGAEVHLHHTDPRKPDTDGDGLPDGQEINQTRTNPLTPDTDGDGVPDGTDGSPLEPEVEVFGYKDGDGVPEVLLARKPSGVMMFDSRIVLPRAITFDGPRGTTLTKADKELLRDVVTLLTEFPSVKLQIEGHFAAGTPNAMALSDQRAQAMRSHLVSRGVAPNRLTAIGQGDQVPVAPNTTPEGRARNTRIDLLIVAK